MSNRISHNASCLGRLSIFFGCLVVALAFGPERFVAQALTISNADRGAVVIAGATGYIGKSTVRESVRQGYNTFALVRSLNKVNSDEGQLLYGEFFRNAKLIECDVSNPAQLEKVQMHENGSL